MRGNKISASGVSPKWVKSNERRRKKERERERKKDNVNNGHTINVWTRTSVNWSVFCQSLQASRTENWSMQLLTHFGGILKKLIKN